MNTEVYLRRRGKVYVREGTGGATPVHVATAQKELAAIGYVFSEALAIRLGTLSVEQLASWLRDMKDLLQRQVGAHRAFKPLFPGFPQQVLSAHEAELYLRATLHYLTRRQALEPQATNPPLLDGRAPRVVELGTTEEFEGLLTTLAASRTSLSIQDAADIDWFVRQYRGDVFRLLPATVPFREIRALLGGALLKHVPGNPQVDGFLDAHVETATDVLRLAAAYSGGDASLAESTKFAAMKRSTRRLHLRLLDRSPNAIEDVMRHAEKWKRLAEVLHPGDYAEKYPRAWAAIAAARSGNAPPSFSSRVEALLEERRIDELSTLLQQRPGEFARRLDVLMRRASDADAIVDAFSVCASKVSTPILLQLLAQTRAPRPLWLRAFTPKGSIAKVFGTPDKRPTIAPESLARAANVCETTLLERFAQLPAFGRCYVDQALTDYVVPMSQRAAAKSLRTLVRGSRLPMPDGQFVRLFLWWKNGKSRTDIDLSVAFFDANFVFRESVAYYNLKAFGGYHSGDIVDATQGAAEFIDLEIAALKRQNIRYAVASINSFTEQPYCDLPECFAGWMARADINTGEPFEPRTVVDRVDIASNTRICLPFAMDLEERQVLWADLGLTEHPRWNNVHNNLRGVSLMLQALIHTPRPDLYTLFTLHARARGHMVNLGEQADTVFSAHEGVKPFDVDVIRQQFL